MVTESFKRLETGLNPSSGSGNTEWFSVPEGHEYICNIVASNIATDGATTTSFRLAVVSSSGATPTAADWYTPYDTELAPGEYDKMTLELDAGRAVVVNSDSGNVAFNITGLDRDVSV